MILTSYTLLDSNNPDPTKRRTKREDLMWHEWHNLRRGMPMRGGVIVGFWRGNGGMYASYGPSVDEVCGWTTVRASQAKNVTLPK